MKNKTKEYTQWLEKRNLSSHTVRSYLWSVREYGNRDSKWLKFADFESRQHIYFNLLDKIKLNINF